MESGSDLQHVIDTYFDTQAQDLVLAEGETLFRIGERNDRLYLVREGTLSARVGEGDGDFTLFEATSNRFVGVYSFFSGSHRAQTTVVAECTSRLSWIDAEHVARLRAEGAPVLQEFMPVVVGELFHRHQQTMDLARTNERALRKLVQSEKLASLGQMAAGIAHELNNAIAVVGRNGAWLRDAGASLARRLGAREAAAFEAGGAATSRSMRDVRSDARGLEARTGVAHRVAHRAAEMALTEGNATQITEAVEQRYEVWRMGAAFRDLIQAADQAAHVVHSVRSLGAPTSSGASTADVNASIEEALTLLKNPLRRILVTRRLGALPTVRASSGDLVQIWTNLLQNAAEAIADASLDDPEIVVETQVIENAVQVSVSDNGPGIRGDLGERVFEPSVTTKVGGLSFGLGLGLTIVRRLVDGAGGTVGVSSRPGCTIFTVQIPIQEET